MKEMKFYLFVGGEFIGEFKCPYDDKETYEENIAAAKNSFLFMFECPVEEIELKNVVVG